MGQGRKRRTSKEVTVTADEDPEVLPPLFRQHLPADVSNLLFTFLRVKEICIFDKAITNWKARKVWTQWCAAINGPSMFPTHFRHTLSSLQWVISHRIKLSGLALRKIARKGKAADNLQKAIAQLKSPVLTMVNMSYMGATLTDKALIQFTKNNPQLTSLQASSTKLKNKSIIALAKSCPHLQSVILNNCLGVGNRGAIELVVCCSDMNILDVSGCSGVTDAFAKALYDHAPSVLKSLNLSRVGHLSDSGVQMIAFACSQLEYINLSADCEGTCGMNITDESCFALATHCNRLKAVNLNYTDVTVAGVVALVQVCEYLERIRLEYVPRIDGEAISEIGKNARAFRRLATLKLISVRGNNISIEDASNFKRECPFVLLGVDLLDRGLDLRERDQHERSHNGSEQ